MRTTWVRDWVHGIGSLLSVRPCPVDIRGGRPQRDVEIAGVAVLPEAEPHHVAGLLREHDALQVLSDHEPLLGQVEGFADTLGEGVQGRDRHAQARPARPRRSLV